MQDYTAGAALVELAALAEPERVPETVATRLGIAEQDDRRPLAVLVEALRGHRLLLVLDNCEHLVAACAELADQLLRTCSERSIIATSREALGIEGETAWRVPSLSVPDSRQEATSLEVMRSEAGRLFYRPSASRAAKLRSHAVECAAHRGTLCSVGRNTSRYRFGCCVGTGAIRGAACRAVERCPPPPYTRYSDGTRPPANAAGDTRLELCAALRIRAASI